MMTSPLPPIVKSLDLPRSTEVCFDHFTKRFGAWWPLATHAAGDDVVDAVIELRVGGRVYERGADGAETDWGQVTVFDRPSRLVFSFVSWTTGTPESEVEVVFTATGEHSTRVELTHRNWDKLEGLAPGIRGRYDGGWDLVFGECFAAALRG
ncbi:MAG: hypothetical protein ACI9MC_003321 [Kiritimatiellia bacterium]|jgi:hypothetical protein